MEKIKIFTLSINFTLFNLTIFEVKYEFIIHLTLPKISFIFVNRIIKLLKEQRNKNITIINLKHIFQKKHKTFNIGKNKNIEIKLIAIFTRFRIGLLYTSFTQIYHFDFFFYYFPFSIYLFY